MEEETTTTTTPVTHPTEEVENLIHSRLHTDSTGGLLLDHRRVLDEAVHMEEELGEMVGHQEEDIVVTS